MITNIDSAAQISERINALQTLGSELLETVTQDKERFSLLIEELLKETDELETLGKDFNKENPNVKLHIHCACISASLKNIKELADKDIERCKTKIEFEFLCMVRGAYALFYYWASVYPGPDKIANFKAEEMAQLMENRYIRRSMETGKYKYQVSFFIIGYNKLDYTKMCVENLLKNIPEGLSYELILYNHGSTDGTKEYFESVHPTKQIDVAINGGDSTLFGFVEGEYLVNISNDIIITENAIQNLLNCMMSDEKIGWAVPATCNVSNLQGLQCRYSDLDELAAFAKNNNISDPCRWEQRTRLCNPIDICRSSVYLTSEGALWPGNYYISFLPPNAATCSDDRFSLVLRRKKYRLMLVKDAYCHHYGSVTIKDEVTQKNEHEYYLNGRRAFFSQYNVDPWGPGHCFDPVFLNRVVGDVSGHADVLGINCGMGSDSLKIKEQIKEYCRNMDTALYNITSEEAYVEDLQGIGDYTELIKKMYNFEKYLNGKKFDYIVWDDVFLRNEPDKTLMRICKNSLKENGQILLKLTEQTSKLFELFSEKRFGDHWLLLDYESLDSFTNNNKK